MTSQATIDLASETYVIFSEDHGMQVLGDKKREGVADLNQIMRAAETMDEMPTVDPAIAEEVVAELSRRDDCEYHAEFFAVCRV